MQIYSKSMKNATSPIQKSQQICISGGDVYYASRNLLSTCFIKGIGPHLQSQNQYRKPSYLLFFPIISSAVQSSAIWLRIARSAMHTLRSVCKNKQTVCMVFAFLHGLWPYFQL